MSSVVAIVGLGYVGLPLAMEFAEAGVDVIGVDVDAPRVSTLREGRSHIEDVSDERLQAALPRCSFTTRMVDAHDADAVLVCVPTPLNANREPELGALLSVGRGLGAVMRSGQIIILESTTFPGTTRDYIKPLLEESGLRAGVDFALAFSPERVDPGRTDYTIKTTPKIVGGLTDDCTEKACAVYAQICDRVVPVGSPEVAELAKLLENVFRSVNIALVNEMAIMADRMGIDIWEVIDAASTKPYGFMRFEPGPGMGGHCLPVDPFYLTWRAREFDMSTEFIELAGKVNQDMPYFCVEKIEQALNDQRKPVNGSRVVLFGVSYKPGVGDIRESPALKIIDILRQRGAEIVYHDPYVPELAAEGLAHTPIDEALEGADIAVIVTAHPSVDHEDVVRRAPVSVDFRGTTRHVRDAPVLQLGRAS
jgi:UDP-N-acetyl-D-glucosamine dehydrogenase